MTNYKNYMNMKKILFVVGSTRRQSFNRQVADYVCELLQSRAEVSCLDYADVPFVNQDIEFPAPESVIRVREAVKAADALWVLTPENNYSYPGLVKNLFDWLSRPLTAGDYETPTPIREKRVALTGIGGAGKTSKCREKLAELLTFIGAEVAEPSLGLRVDMAAWGTNQLTLDEEQKAQLAEQADSFLGLL